ncbi:MAG: peptide-methionine (S)-S-oxide reductase MsrA [Flavobacteriales bacterium]|nr:peptide-methionine (S)-S-oxide reductase MsrA [Flavobacteriales bacterium]
MQKKGHLKPLLMFIFLILFSCTQAQKPSTMNDEKGSKATFGMGCFWCVEAMFDGLKGVANVESGFSGGASADPSYYDVVAGTTGHAEVCQITFDETVISYKDLLSVFWKMHDPTTLNQQGADRGTQYRSVIFFHNDEQQQIANETKISLDASGAWDNPIVTEITKYEVFYVAGDDHKDYYLNNPENSYCIAVVGPKVERFRKVFADKLKENN